MTVSAEMPRYRCHKIVHALKIRLIQQTPADVPSHEGGSWRITPEDTRYAPFDVSHDWYVKRGPQEGGYYVVYPGDGYASYSPAKAFEDGYTLIQPGSDTASAEQPDFRQRVRNEKAELDDKLAKLQAFVVTPMFDALKEDERERMGIQLRSMTAYSEVLSERIAAF